MVSDESAVGGLLLNLQQHLMLSTRISYQNTLLLQRLRFIISSVVCLSDLQIKIETPADKLPAPCLYLLTNSNYSITSIMHRPQSDDSSSLWTLRLTMGDEWQRE